MQELTHNEGKNEFIEVDGVRYSRRPIKTHVIGDGDNISQVCTTYAAPAMQEGDVLFISEKCVACTQKRAIYMKDIKPRKLAVLLSHFVMKTPHGIGLGIPETMEMALRECGTVRILFAAFIGAIGKLLGKHGWFYIIAGPKASSIDGPCPNTIPPYNECVVLGPENPDETAAEIAKNIGHTVIIVDINDLGGNILGSSDAALDRPLYARILKDNPLGQSGESTPMGIIRKAA
jgi:F420-0:gamma-glutamyl ligase-like protein